MLSSLTAVNVRRVNLPAGLIAGPHRFRAVLDRDRAGLLNIFLIPSPLYAYYSYDVELVL